VVCSINDERGVDITINFNKINIMCVFFFHFLLYIFFHL
jgi:hypothetical protein